MKNHGEELIYSRAWIKAVGPDVAAIGVTKEIMAEDEAREGVSC